jgi:hypothetical protein
VQSATTWSKALFEVVVGLGIGGRAVRCAGWFLVLL